MTEREAGDEIDQSTRIIMEIAGDNEFVQEILRQFYHDFGYNNLFMLQVYVTVNHITPNEIWSTYVSTRGSEGGETAGLKKWIS